MTIFELIKHIEKKYKGEQIEKSQDLFSIKINGVTIVIDKQNEKFSADRIEVGRTTIFDLKNLENFSVVMLLLKLLKKGYSGNSIILEKKWQTGHDPIFLDVFLINRDNNEIYMIEVKTINEFQKYSKPSNESKIKQLFSYAMQETSTKLSSFYSYDFENETDRFANVFCSEIRESAQNVDDFYERWNKIFDNADYIEENPVFNIKKTVKTHSSLKRINNDDTQSLFYQFLTILRLNSISDKPNAFMKMINLFLSKIADEVEEDRDFIVLDKNGNTVNLRGMKFQYIEGLDTPKTFMKRLNELYKIGMETYLNKTIIDYNDEEINNLLSDKNRDKILEAFDNLRLMKSNDFAFLEVYDDKTFLENFVVVRDIVKILENYILRYGERHQFLGDFFESLLNTSLKQEAGQFFTPTPLVDYMVYSLDYEKRIMQSIAERSKDFIPKVIDYACGAGHFLVSSMNRTQDILNMLSLDNLTKSQLELLNSCKASPYSWADKRVVGIEKDYRLAKTTKIAGFLNGDGAAEIIAGDGINKFDSVDYLGSILYSQKNTNEIFDYVISNPPYSVEGFMQNFIKNNIYKGSGTFSLLDGELNMKDSAIEIYFIERMGQLLKKDGIGAIILPQSFLSQDKYIKARNYIFANFKILSLLLTADITFSGTTTSPVVMFLKKENLNSNLDYNIFVACSPKYSNPNGQKMKIKEVAFLGYEFSSNRSKKGIDIKHDSILKKLTPLNNSFIENGFVVIPDKFAQYAKIVNLSDIVINKSKDIYPKRVLMEGKKLNEIGCEINKWKDSDFGNDGPTEYLEISDMKTQVSTKSKNSNRFCKEGDILISSLLPNKDQIVIAKGNFKLTAAIHVLSFEDEDIRDTVFNELKKDYVLQQIHALLDGFKVTYSKISETNLFNNISLKI